MTFANTACRSRSTVRTLTLTAALSALAAGCASTGAPTTANSLAQYEQLTAGVDGVRSFRAADAGSYRLPSAGRIEIRVAPGAAADHALGQELRGELAAALSAQLQRAGLSAGDDAPPATVRAVVTSITTANPVVNAITTVLLFAPVSRGGVTVEIEAVDESSGRRIAALAYQGSAGAGDIGKAYTASGHARLEANRAAERFAAVWSGQPLAKVVAANTAK